MTPVVGDEDHKGGGGQFVFKSPASHHHLALAFSGFVAGFDLTMAIFAFASGLAIAFDCCSTAIVG